MRWILAMAVTATTAFASPAWSQDCAATIDSNDQIQFVQKQLTVSSSCESFSLTLRHTGTLDAKVMGHNWVLTRTADYQAVATMGMAAGASNDFVPPGDNRVIAATPIIGGGEETTISFDVSELQPGGDYTYFCSFPGHYAVMNGKLIVE